MSAITTEFETPGPSFANSLWLTGLLLRATVTSLLIGLTFVYAPALPVLAGLLALDLACYIWTLMRYSDSASRHLQDTGRFWPVAGGFALFFMLALAMLTSWWLLFDASEIDLMGKNRSDSGFSGTQGSPGRFVAEFSRDQRQITFKGVMAQGTVDEFAIVMESAPQLETVILHSAGGNVREARLIAAEVRRLGLDTHVDNECSASCLLVFMAGQNRSLGFGAQLGFHRYGLDFVQVLPHVNPLNEMRIDQNYFVQRGINLAFVDKIFDLNRDAIWYPTRAELLAAGVLSQ